MPPRSRAPRGGGSLQHLGGDRWKSQGIDALSKRRTMNHRATTKREAVEAHQRFMVRIGADDGQATKTATVNDLLDAWWPHKKTELKATTRYRHERCVELVREHLGPVKLANLRPRIIDEFYRTPGMTPDTAHTIAGAVLVQALERAVDWGWITANPARRARLPKLARKEHKPPTREAVDLFVRQLYDDRDVRLAVLIHLLSRTGLRKGEALGLRWTDIDWQVGTIRVERSVARLPDQGVIIQTPKTAKSKRTVTVPAETLEVLSRWGELGADIIGGVSPFASPAGETWLFPGDPAAGDRPCSPGVIDATFNRAKKRHGITWRLHDLRHGVATLLLSGGLQLRAVADILGHSDPAITSGIYAHTTAADLTRARELLSGQ